MFIGHYAAAFALSAPKPRVPLWKLFIGVQLIDLLWVGFILGGIEKVRLVKGFMAASNLDLFYMPYTHSLPAAVFWSVLAGAVTAILWRQPRRLTAGIIMAAAVGSHWIADYIVHAPDLLLYPNGPKVGLGLWNSLIISQALEIGLLAIGLIVYVATTTPRGWVGRLAPTILFILLVGVQLYSVLLAPLAESPAAFAIQALFAFCAIAAVAGLFDVTRRTID